MNNSKIKLTPFTYVLIGIIIVLGVLYLLSNNSKFSQLISGSINNPTQNPYSDCINWQETELHDGDTVCVIGRVIGVENNIVEATREQYWIALFSTKQNSFRLLSWGNSLDSWEGKCVVIRGRLIDRAELDLAGAPRMVNSPMDSGFLIKLGTESMCQ